ncbi:unnamed protein product [Adineta ricciae]|nr:unnamed protein product [Adineta ricciae]
MDPNNVSSSNLGNGNNAEYNHPSTQSTITAFLAKLWALVNDPLCDDLITWDVSGASFHVYDQSRFSREILPRYFKHNNFASFIRQLNMYGFRKISNIEHGSLKNERDDIEFAHPHFVRGQESLLELIKRRAPDPHQKSGIHGGGTPSALVSVDYLDSKSGRSIEYGRLLDDVRNLQSKQTSLSDKLSCMQSENQALWGEIGSLRQKHAKQQQIVSKLMEFLLHFISSQSGHHQDQSVAQQQLPKEGLIANSGHPDGTQSQHHANNAPLDFNEQGLSPASLKRKHVALMHNDEPHKRMHTEQQQHPNAGHSTNLGRQQSVTINELTDSDASGWHPTTNSSPVIDLVPSPPPSINDADDNYQWSSGANDSKQNVQQNATFQPVGNENDAGNMFTPDFYLRADNKSNVHPTNQQADGAKSAGTKASQINPISLKEELIEQPNVYQQADQQQHKPGLPMGQLSFSLDDITGDVDHIQSSLDNIRDLMFEHLPDGSSIEDLFAGENDLLLPLLHETTTNGQTPNLLLENTKDQRLSTGDHISNEINHPTNSQSVPNVNNQLLEQLMTENAKIEQQQNTINQLEQQKTLLENKVHLLEQQTRKHR